VRVHAGRRVLRAHHGQILERILKVGKEHGAQDQRAPEVAFRKRNARDRKDDAVEDVAFVHPRGEHEEGERDDRARLEQRAIRSVLAVAPNR